MKSILLAVITNFSLLPTIWSIDPQSWEKNTPGEISDQLFATKCSKLTGNLKVNKWFRECPVPGTNINATDHVPLLCIEILNAILYACENHIDEAFAYLSQENDEDESQDFCPFPNSDKNYTNFFKEFDLKLKKLNSHLAEKSICDVICIRQQDFKKVKECSTLLRVRSIIQTSIANKSTAKGNKQNKPADTDKEAARALKTELLSDISTVNKQPVENKHKHNNQEPPSKNKVQHTSHNTKEVHSNIDNQTKTNNVKEPSVTDPVSTSAIDAIQEKPELAPAAKPATAVQEQSQVENLSQGKVQNDSTHTQAAPEIKKFTAVNDAGKLVTDEVKNTLSIDDKHTLLSEKQDDNTNTNYEPSLDGDFDENAKPNSQTQDDSRLRLPQTDDIDQDHINEGDNEENVNDDYGNSVSHPGEEDKNENPNGKDTTKKLEQKKTSQEFDNMYVRDDRFIEAEDSHFFVYFLTTASIFILGYVAFHNKNKILAYALEGRRNRNGRRRPNTAGYRKLDCNLEEAITSNSAHATVTNVVY